VYRRHAAARWCGRAATIAAAIWLGYLAGLCVLSVAPRLVGWQPRAVLTGSMAPSLPAGSLVLTAPVRPSAGVRAGDIVVVRDSGGRLPDYVHRVVGRDPQGQLVTKGDANAVPDWPQVAAENVTGQVRVVVPQVGWPLVWWHEGRLLPLLACVAGSWLALVGVMRSRQGERGADLTAISGTQGQLGERSADGVTERVRSR
jgi:signal peptidase I